MQCYMQVFTYSPNLTREFYWIKYFYTIAHNLYFLFIKYTFSELFIYLFIRWLVSQESWFRQLWYVGNYIQSASFNIRKTVESEMSFRHYHACVFRSFFILRRSIPNIFFIFFILNVSVFLDILPWSYYILTALREESTSIYECSKYY